MTHDEMLDFYTRPAPFTTLGATAAQVDALPADVGVLSKTVQNLLIHRFWAPAYRVDVAKERENEQGIHSAEGTIASAMRRRAAPITAPRLAGDRALGICRNFTVVMVAFLRKKGIPARSRCGFSSYFQPGKLVDHWVAEYWNAEQARWVMVDAQLDALQVAAVKPDFDPLDVPPERFWVAGQAWQRVRAGDEPGERFGIADMWGDWYVVGNTLADMQSLLGIEMLPWECPIITEDRAMPVGDDLALVDRIAALCVAGDAPAIREIGLIYDADDRLSVSQSRIDAILRDEAVGATSVNPLTA
jgi:hypothetical protein